MNISLLIKVVTIILTFYIQGRFARIIKGHSSNIKDFPHSVFLSIECHLRNKTNFFTCGASVLIQNILLTAAHCVDDCSPSGILAYTGHEQMNEGFKTQVSSFIMHENYDHVGLDNDIALLRLRIDLQFGDNVKRVALLRQPPYYKSAVLASWSRIDDRGAVSNCLMHKAQSIMTDEECVFVLGEHNLPAGAFCAREERGTSYLGRPASWNHVVSLCAHRYVHFCSFGVHVPRPVQDTIASEDFWSKGVASVLNPAPDQTTQWSYAVTSRGSGSALIVRNFIQIGILSFNMPGRSKTIAVYTDIGYFYEWIRENTRKLFCYNKQ